MGNEDEYVRLGVGSARLGKAPEMIRPNLELLEVILEQNQMILEMNKEMLKLLGSPPMVYDPGFMESEYDRHKREDLGV
jgi:hypothetical protein